MLTLFFLKQKTAYEMRISDWSSDVCSSDLGLHRALTYAALKLDEDLATIIVGAQRSPRRAVAFDGIAEIDVGEVDAGGDGTAGFRLRVLAAQRDELILRILPGDRRPIGALGRAQLHVISTPIGVDYQILHQVRAGRLHQDVELLGCA